MDPLLFHLQNDLWPDGLDKESLCQYCGNDLSLLPPMANIAPHLIGDCLFDGRAMENQRLALDRKRQRRRDMAFDGALISLLLVVGVIWAFLILG